MKIQLSWNLSTMSKLTIATFLIGTAWFSTQTISTAYNNNNGTGNCMLVYVRNLVNGTASKGVVYQFPNGTLHVEPLKESNGEHLRQYDYSRIGVSTDCDFSNVGLSSINSKYNTMYCVFAKKLTEIGVISAQTNEKGEW